MKIGDFVWFKKSDDLYCGEDYSDMAEAGYLVGRVIKLPNSVLNGALKENYDFSWVAVVPVPSRLNAVPLWAIPNWALKLLSNEEAMLVMLENN